VGGRGRLERLKSQKDIKLTVVKNNEKEG